MRKRKRYCYPTWIDDKLKELRERRALYKDREKKMLEGGAKQYTIGSRSKTDFDTPLSNVTEMIDKIDQEIRDLEAIKNGGSARRAFGAVPRDDW